MTRFVLWLSYLVAASAVAVMTVLWRSWMPPVLPPATSSSVFSGQASYDTLRNITTAKHPLQSQANLDVHHYLYDQLVAINSAAAATGNSSWSNGLVFITSRSDLRTADAMPPADATPRRRRCKDYEEIINHTQIIVRVPGKLSSSVLLTAHFDSAPSSFGASDDGAGVAVILETLRAILASPTQPDHSLVVFLDNGEEIDFCGSEWFVQSDLVKDLNVKVLINLEGGGAGGRAIMFRATDNKLASLYGQVAPYPHMNSMGGSLMGLLGSDTDYSVYQESQVPGIDIAFYEHREFYHTPGDNMDHISAQDVQHCGENVLAFTRALLNTNSPDEWVSDDHALYFDLMGRRGFTLTVATRWIVVAIVWLTSIAVVVLHFQTTPINEKPSLREFVKSHLGLWLYFAAAVAVGSVLALLANLPLVVFLMVKDDAVLAWTALPSAVCGHVAGVAYAAGLWRRRQGVASTLPPATPWISLATAGSTFGALLTLVFPLNAPLLYLFPIATWTYSVVLLVAIGVFRARQRDVDSHELIEEPDDSPTATHVVAIGDEATMESTPQLARSVVLSLVATFAVFVLLAFPIPLDTVWMIQSVGGYDPIIMGAAPVLLTPVMYLAMPWLVTWEGKVSRVLGVLYVGVWVAAVIHYAVAA